ncbi:hypothetical protein INT46_009829 [Mucor plumbeus]|uniref:DinB-like domain-containing protein n=1 Tax=Mucor plumbeus TaxID=97098 RepID=A0A8H7QW39_9FUNG|nr:hypothetical protein INT46_009829 [Mucor plumbeus]
MSPPAYDTMVIPNSPPEEKKDHVPIQEMACDILQQGIDLIQLLQDEQYTQISKVIHVSDHFNLLYKQCQPIPSDWVVDYDIRARNNPSEMNRSIAIQNLEQLKSIIKDQSYIPLDQRLTLLATIDASDNNKYRFASSFGRELFYSCIHAIHHYASIKAICIEQNISTPQDFGMAPSTLQDHQSK